ncbi:MAG: hypothetical protein JST26_01565 [Bacteroidetes bacterium]|nr:hypothetical protein [Bacteroidota bacterium]
MKKILSILSFLIPAAFLGQVTTTTLSSSGSFVVPCGVTSITVQCWGGGGGGGAATGKPAGGGGGAGGAFSQSVIAVSAGVTINYTVGTGGSGSSTGTGSTGGNTTFFGVIASGGVGGAGATVNSTSGAGGTGSSAGSVGTTIHAGGSGGTGSSGSTAGGGGGSAGTTAVGGNGGATTAGSGGATGGAAGGAGGSGSAGSNGTVPGGGGGGGQTSVNNDKSGGDGANGQIVLSYSGAATANAGADQAPTGCVTTATLAGNSVAGYSGYWTCVNNCGVTITTPTLNSSTVTGLIVNQPVTLRWTLTETATGCVTGYDDVIITATNCPPSNDNACSASSVTVNSTYANCTLQTGGTVLGATASGLALGACGGTADDDVWFKFTATNSTQIISLNNVAGSVTDMYFSVHSGACGSLGAALLCSDPNSGTVSGLTVGTTYYIRVYTYTSTSGQTSTFSVCVTPPCSTPANDDACNATALTVNSSSVCTTQTAGTICGATASGQGLGSCSGTADDDVWYKFVATNTSQNISLNNLNGSTTDMYFMVYSGTCSSLGTAILCSDPESNTVTGLTVGNTYYIRVFTYTSTSGQNTTFSVCVSTPCAAPANDNACNATLLTVNSTSVCTSQTAGSICGATASGQALGTCFGTADDDVWYKFVATNSTQSISLNNITGSTSDMYFIVYGGTCSSLGTEILCSDPESNTVSGLTVGNTYYIRVYTYTSTGGQTSTFSVCVTSPCTAPTNDNACSATLLTVNSSTACTSQTAGSVCGATASGQALGTCFGTADDDIWYKFVATNSTQSISLNNITGSTSDMYFIVYGGTCSSLGTEILCSDPESNTVSGLTVGNTYYIRVYTYTSTGGQTSTFSVCVTSPCAAPANDNACNATVVTPNSMASCTLQTAGSVCGATASGQTLGSCSGTADDDVWFKFVANNATQYISLNNITGSTSDMYFMVYSGTCSSLGTAILCSDPESNTLTGLTVGATYYIRVFTYTSTSGQTSTFSVCISAPCPAPSNDEPCSATTATVNSAATCSVTTPGTICGATTSTASIGACGGTADDDVWFKFTATASNMSISLLNVAGSTTDLYHAVYWGTCGALGTELLCSDPNSSSLTGLIIGHTYYIRIYSYTSTSGQTTSFDLCIYPTPPPPSNITCAQMSPFCSGTPIVFQAQSGGGYAAGGPNYGCLSTQPNPTWFYLQIATPGTMAIDLSANSDVDFALWGPYANLSAAQAACSSYPTPLDCSYSSSNIEQMNIANALVGEVYAVLVTNYANVVQQITLNQAGGATATTNCAIVTLPIGLLSFNVALNSNEQAEVNWITETEVNNDYFEVQRSADSYNWEVIGTKKGQGNTTNKTSYQFLDKAPLGGVSYYRLKQVDFDKKFTYTNIAPLDLSKVTEGITNLHPNPTNDFVTCDLYAKSRGNVDIELIDYTDHTVYSRT